MSDKKEYSVEEILQDVKRISESTADDLIDNILKEENGDTGLIKDTQPVDAETGFDDTRKEEKVSEKTKEVILREKNEEGTGAKEDNISIADEKEKNDDFSFEKIYEDKEQIKERNSRTRVFKKESIGSDNDREEAKIEEESSEASNSETAFEKEFKEKRREKIDRFRLFTENLSDDRYGEDEDDAVNISDMVKAKKGEDIFETIENTDKPKKENSKRREKKKKRDSKVYEKIDVGRVKLRLGDEARKIRIRKIMIFICFILCLIVGVMKTAYVNEKLLFLSPVMEANPIIVYAVEFVLGVVPLVIWLKAFADRIKENEKPTLCSEALIAILFLLNTFHNAVLILTKPDMSKNIMLFGTAVCFIALLELYGESMQNRMIRRNLLTLVRNENIMGVFALESENEKLASGISKSKEPMILCAGEVEIPNSFLDSSMTKDKENMFLNITIPVSVLLSVVCGVIAFIAYGGILSFSSALVSAVLVSAPAFISPVLVRLIARTNETLNRTGCEILGYEDVENIDETDAIVLDTADIFTGNISHFHLVSRKANIDTLHAFEIACSVIYSSGGVLKGEIAEFMKEQKIVLPKVEDITYEERLGLSCWVEDKCVLLGTDKMMQEHNIIIPPEYSGEKYEREGSKVFYLAVDTYATAMFCADYFIGRMARKQLVDLYKTGVILMLMTTDPHIDETFVANTLGVSDSSIKIVSPVGAKQIRESISKTTRQKRTGLIFKKNVVGLLKVINAAFRLYDVQSLAILIQTVSLIFAAVVSGVLSAAATGYLPGVIFIIAYHSIWTALGYFVTHKNSKKG